MISITKRNTNIALLKYHKITTNYGTISNQHFIN